MESKDAGAGAAARNDGNVAANTANPTTSTAPTTDKAVLSPNQTRNNNNSPVSGVPTPQVGTGGSDFFLFTQARAALGADEELKAANVVIDVKAGLLTLSGTVANADQKSKAEQLVRAVDGVKAVKNQLRISIASAEAAPRVQMQ
ncbi:MAG: BON domain-containing protein [Pyrinomonadaceae bacterium]|nr:BON domain-containing protein [Pyrinomonadaceae bacterium]